MTTTYRKLHLNLQDIHQIIDICAPFDKMNRLTDFLRSKPRGYKAIVFCGTKRMCDQVTITLGREFGAAAIHGDKRQQERDWVLRSFKENHTSILVATDVAARGLDIKDVECVINFDFPQGVEDYIHRIGRTGRAGKKGEALTLFTQEDGKYAKELVGVMRDAKQEIPGDLENLARNSFASKGRNRWANSGGGGRGGFGGGGGGYGGGGGFGGGGGYGGGGGGYGGGGFGGRDRGGYGGSGGGAYGRRDRSPGRY